MTNDSMGTTSLAYHIECKEKREKKKQEDETLILLLEEENAIETI